MVTRVRSGWFALKKAKSEKIKKCYKNMEKRFVWQFKYVLANEAIDGDLSLDNYKKYIDRKMFKWACDLYDILNNETIWN